MGSARQRDGASGGSGHGLEREPGGHHICLARRVGANRRNPARRGAGRDPEPFLPSTGRGVMGRRLAAIDALGRVRRRRSAPGLRVIERKLLEALLAIFGLILWTGAAAATPAGTVVGVSGASTDRGRVLNHGDTVQIGDTLDVPAGGSLKVRMADGSIISLASGTSITVANYD